MTSCIQIDEMTTTGAQDLRISVPASTQQLQQQPPVTEPVTASPSVSAPPPPPPPPFGLGLIAVGPHTSFATVPMAPTSDTASTGGATALNIPMIRQSSSGASGTAGGGAIRRRVSDKTALPISAGDVLLALKVGYISMFACYQCNVLCTISFS